MSNAGGKWVFMYLKGRSNATFIVIQELSKAPQTWKIPRKVLKLAMTKEDESCSPDDQGWAFLNRHNIDFTKMFMNRIDEKMILFL